MATIWYFSPTGNDSTGTGASGNPWKTINKASLKWNDGTIKYGDTCRWVGTTGDIFEPGTTSVFYVKQAGGSPTNMLTLECQTPLAILFHDDSSFVFEKRVLAVPYINVKGFSTIGHLPTPVRGRNNSDRSWAPGPVPGWVAGGGDLDHDGALDPGGDYCIIENCYAYNYSEPFKANRVVGTIFRNCESRNTQWGMGLFGCESCIIEHCKVYDFVDDGIQLKGNVRNCLVRHNEIIGSTSYSGHGIMLGAASGATGGAEGDASGTWLLSGWEAYNCHSYGNIIRNPSPFVEGEGGGIWHALSINAAMDCSHENNVVYNTRTAFAVIDVTPYSPGWTSDMNSHNPTWRNNIVKHIDTSATAYDPGRAVNPIVEYNCYAPDCIGVPSVETGAVKADPLFVNANGGNFHLQSGSPCRGAGKTIPPYPKFNWTRVHPLTPNPTGTVTIDDDALGFFRSVPWDMGIYEETSPSGSGSPVPPPIAPPVLTTTYDYILIPDGADRIAGRSLTTDQSEIDRWIVPYMALRASGNGITTVGAGKVTPKATPAMKVDVAGGGIIVNGVQSTISGQEVAIDAASANDRFDLIVAGTGQVIYIKGTPVAAASGGPVYPNLPDGYTQLAAILVQSTTTAIAAANITELRFPPVTAPSTPATATESGVIPLYTTVPQAGATNRGQMWRTNGGSGGKSDRYGVFGQDENGFFHNDWRIYPGLEVQAALSFGTILAGDKATATIDGAVVGGIIGAMPGDAVVLIPPSDLEAGIIPAGGWVPGSGVVTVCVANTKGFSITPSSKTWGVIVLKRI